MTLVHGPVTVRVPATSANLGPGYDSLGLALGVHDELTAEVLDGDALEIDVVGEGADDVPRTADHLVVRAMDAAFGLMGVPRPGLRLTCRNHVPHARGMGSSSAAIVGGIVLARALVPHGPELMTDGAAYQLANDLEGHPDNVAPALFGGFTIAWVDGAAVDIERLDVDLPVTLMVPPWPVSTVLARGLLPAQVPHEDAALTAGRAALLVAALLHAPHRLISATEDRLHQPYRAAAMPESHKLLRRLRVEGIPAVVSGAGPTVLSFAEGIADLTPEGWTVLETRVEARGAHVV